jgi:hypothetical protein
VALVLSLSKYPRSEKGDETMGRKGGWTKSRLDEWVMVLIRVLKRAEVFE